MPYTQRHNVLVVHGTIQQGPAVDIWQFGLRLAPPDAFTFEAGDDFWQGRIADVKADVQKWWSTGFAGRVAPTCALRGVKFNPVGTDGKYVKQDESYQADYGPTGLPGQATARSLPPQVATVVTLLTDAGRGLASKGRVYLPALASNTLGEGGVLGSTIAEELEAGFAQLVRDLNNWPNVDAIGDAGDVAVMSKVRTGATRKVTAVSVGERFDVQRRRANRLPEVRGAVTAI